MGLSPRSSKLRTATTTPTDLALIRDGMRAVVSDPNGTVYFKFLNFPTAVAGKSGTAETPSGNPDAWFIAFAPAEAPQVAVAVIVERGGSLGNEATGGAVAAPIAARLLRIALGK